MKLETLGFRENQIGDEGMMAFAETLKPTYKFPMESLPQLAIVFVIDNPGNGMGVKEACSARGITCYA